MTPEQLREGNRIQGFYDENKKKIEELYQQVKSQFTGTIFGKNVCEAIKKEGDGVRARYLEDLSKI